jgi:hypothetical protein
VYEELRKLAASKLAHEKPGQTLQATALVHEVYLRLVGPANRNGFDNRGHFFAAAAEAMRRILMERGRRQTSSMKCLSRVCNHATIHLPVYPCEVIANSIPISLISTAIANSWT